MPKAARHTMHATNDALESGVVLKSRRNSMKSSAKVPTHKGTVRLLVYVWRNVQPGIMSWVFPNARAALVAARAMSNAARWIVVRGDAPTTVSEARKNGSILFEQTLS